MAMGSKLVGIATGIAVRKVSTVLLDKVWRKTKHSEPPADPASPGTPWAEALTWAAASGVAVGVTRLVATKGVATAKMKLTGKVPEGMEGPSPKRKAVATSPKRSGSRKV
jgi:hypothetical protein